MHLPNFSFNSIRAKLSLVLIVFIGVSTVLACLILYIDGQHKAAFAAQTHASKLKVALNEAQSHALKGFGQAMIFKAHREPTEAEKSRLSYSLAVANYQSIMANTKDPHFKQIFSDYLEQLKQLMTLNSTAFKLSKTLGLTKSDGLQGAMREAAHQLEKSIKRQPNLQVPLLEMRRSEKDYILRQDQQYLDSFEEHYSLLKWRLEDNKVSDQLIQQLEAYRNHFLAFATVHKETENTFHNVIQRHEQLIANLQQTEKPGKAMLSAINNKVEELDNYRNILISVGFPLAGLIIIVLQSYFSRSIDQGIRKVVGTINNTVEKIENGTDESFNLKMGDTDDLEELAAVATSFNRLMDILESLLSQISDVSGNMNLVSTSTQQSAAQNNQSIQRQVAEISELAEAINRMSDAATQIADSTNTASEMVMATDQTAQQGLKTMQEAISISNTVAAEIDKTAEIAREMDRMGEEVGSVMTVIHTITDQTSLLALNAAIEAARAGEVGRGFAVVADEVRSLAMKTSQATESIQVTIEAVQSSIKRMVTAMDNNTEQVQQSVAKNHLTSEALEQIVAATERLSAMNNDIASAAQLHNQESLDISCNITKIETAAAEIAENTMKATSDSGDLSQFSMILNGLVNRVRVKENTPSNTIAIASDDQDVELF